MQLAHEADESRHRRLVDATRHLVEQEQARPGGECPRQLQPLALAGGQPARVGVGAIAEADRLQRALRRRACGAHVGRVVEGADHDVLDRCHAGERPELLERARDPEVADLVGTEGGDVVAVEGDPAGVRPLEAGDQIEERGLAGAVRPDDADQLARRHREGDAPVGHDAAEALGDVRDGEQAHRALPACPARVRSPMSPEGWNTEMRMIRAP